MEQKKNLLHDGSHLSIAERKIIETGCKNGSTKTAIAKTIGKEKSTIGKEIKQHRFISVKCHLPMECKNYRHCRFGRECTINCPDYVLFTCTRRDRSPGVCNGCSSWSKCRFSKYIYDADKAHKQYIAMLVDSRQGVDLTSSEAASIAEIIKPLLKQGQSPYMIVKEHPELGICEKTLYNYIEDGVFEFWGIGPLDLRRQVSRKIPKAKSNNYKKRENRQFLNGRTYKDYMLYMAENPDASVVQMDTVYNDVSNGPFLQTFKFVSLKIVFAVLHASRTAQDMVNGLNLLEQILGETLFNKYVQVLLTDRGGEFSSADAFECRPDGTLRTRVFYCDPMQSGQKGTLENNHIELRYILPKECDLFSLGLTDQVALNRVLSHINSHKKESLMDKSPFDIVGFYAPKVLEKILAFGLEIIPADRITLMPYMLKK